MDDVRLVDYYEDYEMTLDWYKDPYTVKMVDDSDKVYDLAKLKAMYDYLSRNGDLFYIAYKGEIVGDCAIFDKDKLAIVIKKDFQSRSIGPIVIAKLISYARGLGLEKLEAEIYSFNTPSIKLFEKLGFKEVDEDLYRMRI